MSLLDGKVTLDGEFNGGRNGRNNRNNNDRRNNGNNGNNNGGFRENRNGKQRSYDSAGYQFNKSSYLTDEMREAMASENQEPEKKQEHDKRADAMNAFCYDFSDNASDFKRMRDVVIDEFPDAVKYIRNYYNPKNTSLYLDAANRLIQTVCTTQFASALGSVLESGVWSDDGTYDRCWRSIAFVISAALETRYEAMHGDTVRKYATEILPRMWKPEIEEIVTETGVTKDLALDLIIAIPMVGSEWNGSNIDAFYGRFLNKMLEHAEDNMDVLNYEVQGMLYNRFFGSSNTALKVIGKFLTSEPRETFDSDVQEAVYKDFIKMLYTKLDKYDIGEIAYVFKYVSIARKHYPNVKTIFASGDVTGYDNVRKGFVKCLEDDSEAMKYLA
jgi:hypothetical protein